MARPRLTVSCSSFVRPFASPRSSGSCRPRCPLLRPLLTSRSVPRGTSPFQAQGEISPGKGSWPSSRDRRIYAAGFDRWSFAKPSTLAPPKHRLYPLPVRRPATSLPASFGAGLAAGPSRASSPCGSLDSLRSTRQRTFTSRSRPCWAHSTNSLPA
jgi:hypothetical protein